MGSKEEYDRYAAALTERFDEFVRWAMENWPNKDFPLLQSDFEQSRREIADIAGPKLGDGDSGPPGPDEGKEEAPFIPMNPMPWP
jgi:hypothetical protein